MPLIDDRLHIHQNIILFETKLRGAHTIGLKLIKGTINGIMILIGEQFINYVVSIIAGGM